VASTPPANVPEGEPDVAPHGRLRQNSPGASRQLMDGPGYELLNKDPTGPAEMLTATAFAFAVHEVDTHPANESLP
jgi:hypothetical protein